MPESSSSIVEIHNSLKASLGRGHSDLDQDVVSASKRALLENIPFVPASSPYTMPLDILKAKYISLNPGPVKWDSDKTAQKDMNPQTMNCMEKSDEMPSPKIVLYPEEKVKMEWPRMTRIGAGLVNMGNTCFFNSTLQCLTYTAPLVNYCLSNDHRAKCKKKDFCMMCEIQNHIKSSLDCGGRSIKPHSMLQKLRCIAKHMKWGRQEDAHEFLRFVVDHLQQSCLNGESKLDQMSKDTTVINQIFGGYLRSQVICLRCQGKSNTFDPFMDISLDIKGVNTVEEALAKYVKPEMLEQENAYKCPKCKQRVKAQKRFSIQKAPNVLTLQLNRFDFHRHLSGKINRFIKYPEKINLRTYMSQRQGEPILYHLYGVLVHSGHSSEHGHYYSYVKSPTKTWYCMNDSVVHQVPYNNVFNADAYVLFYARINKPVTTSTNGPSTSSLEASSPSLSKGPIIGALSSPFKPMASTSLNGINVKSSGDLGTPLKRQESASTLSSSHGPKIVASGSALPGVYNKISFPILTPSQKKLFQQQEDGKRIVLQIKHGNSTTMEKSPDGQSKVVNNGKTYSNNQPKVVNTTGHSELANGSSLKTGLVPYNTDSDSEHESTPMHKSPTCNKQEKYSESNGDSHVKQFKQMSSSTTDDQKKHISEKGDVSSALNSVSEKGDTSSTSNSTPGKGDASYTSNSMPLKEELSKHSLQTPHKDSQDVQASSRNGGVAVDTTLSMNTSKVRASGGNWLIQTQGCATSPKSSCSSSANSVISTTEWTVQSKETKSIDIKSPQLNYAEHKTGETKAEDLPSVKNPQSCQVKKHKKKRQTSSEEEEEVKKSKEHSKKKKKHKEKKKKRGKERRTSDNSSHEKKRKKHSRSLSPSSFSSTSSSSSTSDSENGYIWVERTKETAGLVQSRSHPVAVQIWSHHIKDDVAPKKECVTQKLKSTWDGSRHSKLPMESAESSFSLGKNVLSWDGTQNHIDDVKEKPNKRRWSDDEEIDAGKIKKVKKEPKITFSKDYNPFQRCQSDRYSEKAKGSFVWKQDHSYPQNSHQDSKWKTYS